jgi:hypothetical protein
MRAHRWIAAAAVWLAAVTAVATVAWFAIDSAGQEVWGADAARDTALSRLPAEGVLATPSVSGTPAPCGLAGGSGGPCGPGGPGGVSAPGSGGSAGPDAGRARPAQPPPASGRAVSAITRGRGDVRAGVDGTGVGGQPGRDRFPPPVSRLFLTPGGQLVVQCGGPALLDFDVQVADGWRGSTEDLSGQGVAASFSRGSADRVVLAVRCLAGKPVAAVVFVSAGLPRGKDGSRGSSRP